MNLLEDFLSKINYQFKNQKLLEEALTHPSLSKETKKMNYERLEFLGDKVLSLVIADFLMEKFPKEKEGDLSKRQASFVSGETLAKVGVKIGLNQVIKLSKGEENIGGKNNKKNLENCLEALIGAIYLDSNYQEAKKFILNSWQNLLEENLTPPKDPVSELQELIQLKTKQLPEYQIEKISGSDHSPIFCAKVRILHLNLEFEASGTSKKEAQKEVAKIALEKLYHTKFSDHLTPLN